MSTRSLPAAVLAVAAVLALAGCGSGSSSSSAATPSIGAGDRAACDALDQAWSPSQDPKALYDSFGINGSVHGMSQKLAPYALLVGGSAQMLLSGADTGSLGEDVGQMRGVCETMGWRARS